MSEQKIPPVNAQPVNAQTGQAPHQPAPGGVPAGADSESARFPRPLTFGKPIPPGQAASQPAMNQPMMSQPAMSQPAPPLAAGAQPAASHAPEGGLARDPQTSGSGASGSVPFAAITPVKVPAHEAIQGNPGQGNPGQGGAGALANAQPDKAGRRLPFLEKALDAALSLGRGKRDKAEGGNGGTSSPGKPDSDFRRIALTGYAIIIFTFGVMGGWAALANIDAGVVAPGVISVESKRQVVQHLEGGIIKEIKVREGQKVEEGDLLFRLEDTTALANRDAVRNQVYAGLALEARLVAERDDAPKITFPPLLASHPDDPVVKRVITDETAQFTDRRASITGQLNIINGRVDQLKAEIDGLDRERKSAEQQLYFINDELVGIRELALKGLVPKTRQSALEREKARLDGVVGRNLADAAKAQNNIGEMNLQATQTRQKFIEEVGAQLLDVRQKLGDMREKLNVTEDVLRRTEIRAPRGGEAQNINQRIFTVGAVARPGDTLVEIVPQDDELVIEARVQVTDIDNLRTETSTEVRFPAFHSRTTPLILGTLRNVSRDRLVDEQTREPYYLALISVADTDIPPELKGRLRPGMPAEIIFNTGERTVMSYLMRPLTDAMSGAFREH
ncbi:Membrane fusion protein (MFP) family protein [Hyphomicrobiales bacterium]|nr:Membrane fusion protein (MFP) family protein [Hyphomicrobiales bacterium]CAH1665184.1 Membrane fusion protein (MFP) family protein [Hyphomicrobiales bacterium]CAH1678364.1 Membrane fusion protein (MFP) family protein [Hyphomicrobiales bacterium]CAH1680426.1 Membrane fusion protein (MFP) family protein [Hyphomicrobiales bacterium]